MRNSRRRGVEEKTDAEVAPPEGQTRHGTHVVARVWCDLASALCLRERVGVRAEGMRSSPGIDPHRTSLALIDGRSYRSLPRRL
jgi:hypothetical protein